MYFIWEIIKTIILLLTCIVSIRLTFPGIDSPNSHPVWKLIISDYSPFSFYVVLFFVLTVTIGYFGRNEISPIPWLAFSKIKAHDGFLAGLRFASLSLTADLWLLWIPGQEYLRKHPDVDKQKRILIRFLNLVSGLLLLTPHNPIYKFLDWL